MNEIGQIRRNGRILKNQPATNGYVNVCVCKNGKVKTLRLHRVVAEAFIPNPENKPQVNHKDGNRKNNDLKNLEWVTASENHIHAYRVTKNQKPNRNMAGKFGEHHNRSKSFSIEYPSGEKIKYCSGLEFVRLTGHDHTAISWARVRGKKTHRFVRGTMKGLVVHFEIKG